MQSNTQGVSSTSPTGSGAVRRASTEPRLGLSCSQPRRERHPGEGRRPEDAQEGKGCLSGQRRRPEKWNLALNNMKNVQDDPGQRQSRHRTRRLWSGDRHAQARIRCGNQVDQAVADGVKVVACENTMHAMKLTKADMLASTGYVPGGVIELMEKQRQGWSYIKP